MKYCLLDPARDVDKPPRVLVFGPPVAGGGQDTRNGKESYGGTVAAQETRDGIRA
jgi:hypothetical protein